MKLPSDKEIFRDELAVYWIENDELLCSVCTSNPRTFVATKNSFDLIDKITGGRKVCLLSDISAAGRGADKVRQLSVEGSKKHFKLMALITSSAFGSLLGNTFMTISGQPLPMKLFTNEKEAREWVGRKTYMNEGSQR